MSASKTASFFSNVVARRTVYGLTAKSSISDEAIHEIVKNAVLHTPTSFNTQPLRAVVVLKEHHTKLWDIVIEVLRGVVAADRFEPTLHKLQGFQAAYGTILYFTDMTVIRSNQDAFPSYAEQFPVWADNSQGILQNMIWTALAVEGMGANLQHYNPLIDDKVRAHFNLPETWQLRAEATFGIPSAEWKTPEKQFIPIEERVKFFA